jgi:hypothetical protein
MGAFGELIDWTLNSDMFRFEHAMNEVMNKCISFAA